MEVIPVKAFLDAVVGVLTAVNENEQVKDSKEHRASAIRNIESALRHLKAL